MEKSNKKKQDSYAKSWILLSYLLGLIFVGIYLFAKGFLLTRIELTDQNNLSLNPLLRYKSFGKLSFEDLVKNEQRKDDSDKNDQIVNIGQRDCEWFPKNADSVIILLVDALRIDFATFDYTNSRHKQNKDGFSSMNFFGGNTDSPYRNKLPIIENLLGTKPNQAELFRFRSDPPTTTLQRLKGLTTGQLPTFVDAGSNFGGSAIVEDNWISQLLNRASHSNKGDTQTCLNKKIQKPNIVFLGDDTWESLFPNFTTSSSYKLDENTKLEKNNGNNSWVFARPFPSLNVWDLDTVDDGVLSRLPLFLLPLSSTGNLDIDEKVSVMKKKWKNLVFQKSTWDHNDFLNYKKDPKSISDTNKDYTLDGIHNPQDWDLIIGHMLGVDHVGHRYGPDHSEMSRKLEQVNDAISLIVESMDMQSSLSSEKSDSKDFNNSKKFKKTILYVFGDHGMNNKGDHGGDSDEELDAGMFIYSNFPIKSDECTARIQKVYKKSQKIMEGLNESGKLYINDDIFMNYAHNGHQSKGAEIRSVLQVDWVPTISLSLGLPIPFNNLGCVIGEVFCNTNVNISLNETTSENTKNEKNQITQEWGYLHAIRLNAAQLQKYINSYKTVTGGQGFSSEMERQWIEHYTIAEKSYYELVEYRNINAKNKTNGMPSDSSLQDLEEIASINYLVFTRIVMADLRKVWAQFDDGYILFGLVVVVFAVFVIARLFFMVGKALFKDIIDLVFQSTVFGIALGLLVSRIGKSLEFLMKTATI
ncbi:hypothetical protein BB559_007172, partial [Furculomyces boomerangus]